jgi:hypothetical protein
MPRWVHRTFAVHKTVHSKKIWWYEPFFLFLLGLNCILSFLVSSFRSNHEFLFFFSLLAFYTLLENTLYGKNLLLWNRRFFFISIFLNPGVQIGDVGSGCARQGKVSKKWLLLLNSQNRQELFAVWANTASVWTRLWQITKRRGRTKGLSTSTILEIQTLLIRLRTLKVVGISVIQMVPLFATHTSQETRKLAAAKQDPFFWLSFWEIPFLVVGCCVFILRFSFEV